MINVIINETNEHETLLYKDPKTGIDCISDIIGNSGATVQYIKVDEDGNYHMNKDDFEWWSEYIANMESDDKERAELIDKYGEDAVIDIINDEWRNDGNDYDRHHLLNQMAFERIRAELKLVR